MKKLNLKNLLPKILIALVIGFVVWFFFLREKQLTSSVRKVELQHKQISRTVTANGVVKSKNEANLSFSGSGKIISLGVEKGDTVKKGQSLGNIDNSPTYLTAQSLKDARDAIIRQKDLFVYDADENIDALGGETPYQLRLRQFDEQIGQADASYKAQLAMLTQSYLTAPFDASVVDILKKQGESAVMGETIVKLADLNNFVFEIQIDQEDYGLVKEGQKVEITLDSYDTYKFYGQISSLPFYADTSTNNFVVKIDILADEIHQVKLGMLGDAYIVLDSTDSEVSALTSDEIFYDGEDKPYIWVVQNEKLVKRYIEIGLEGDVYTEMKTNIEQEIVVPASDDIKMEEGYKAQIINK